MTVITHPAHQKRLDAQAEAQKKTAKRWRVLKLDHARTERELWCGKMVLNFTDDELRYLMELNYLSESDLSFIRRAGREP